MSHAVIIKNAVKKYGDFTALNGVSLDIKQGEFFTLLGPSGCGKTTLLRMIAGFNTVDGGEICFDDRVINNLEAHKRDIGMVFQNYAIFPHLTVAENVAYGLKAKKCPKDQIPGKVEEALELVQIGKLKDRKPNELSGGQQQRVALARAFVIEPGVLLMDEPLSNLDAKLRVQMRTVIKKLQRRLGITQCHLLFSFQSVTPSRGGSLCTGSSSAHPFLHLFQHQGIVICIPLFKIMELVLRVLFPSPIL